MLKNYIITALRNLWRNKFFSLINIFGLSVGVACCLLIFLYAKDEVTFDAFHKNKENIYHLTADLIGKDKTMRLSSTGRLPGPAFKKHIPEVTEFVRMESGYVNIKNKDEVFEQDILWADPSLFSVFTLPLVYGNSKTALYDLHSVVISETTARRYFGKTDVLGQALQINTTGKQFERFIVSAVVKDPPQNSSIKPHMVLPMSLQEKLSPDDHWVNFFLNTFVVLSPGANAKTVENKMAEVFGTEAAAEIQEMAAKYNDHNKTVFHLQPLLEMHLSTDYPANNGLSESSKPLYSYILIGIAAFILIIACINFVNLTVARSLKRSKEIGIRKVIGSERRQLIFQFLGESFVLSFFAFTIAVLLASVSLPFFNTVSNKELSFSYLLDGRLIAGYVALFLLTGLLAGFYPALVLSAFKPVETLYGKLRLNNKNYLSKGLVVFQFALSTFLIIATITIYKQFNYLTRFDLGYDNSNVVTLRTGDLDHQSLEILKHELYKNAGIQKISADQGGTRYTLAHINGENEINFNFVYLDEDYFSLFKIPVVKGRNFSAHNSSDSATSVVVNEAFVKTAGWKDPLGSVVDFFYNNKKYEVIGVVKNHHFEGPLAEVPPQLFMFTPRNNYHRVYIKLSPFGKGDALRAIEKTFRHLYPMQPYQYTFKDESVAESYDAENKWKQVIGFSAILTVFISCMGLFGLTALSAERRAREVSIRKVLGAPISTIVQKLSGDFIKLVLLASVIALPAAWWAMHKWLQNYPYHIELKLILFGYAVVAIVAIALMTISFHAVKAAVANPVKNLRMDS